MSDIMPSSRDPDFIIEGARLKQDLQEYYQQLDQETIDEKVQRFRDNIEILREELGGERLF